MIASNSSNNVGAMASMRGNYGLSTAGKPIFCKWDLFCKFVDHFGKTVLVIGQNQTANPKFWRMDVMEQDGTVLQQVDPTELEESPTPNNLYRYIDNLSRSPQLTTLANYMLSAGGYSLTT